MLQLNPKPAGSNRNKTVAGGKGSDGRWRKMESKKEHKMEEKSAKFNKTFELVVAILLGITAVITAWSAWQGSLYDSTQAKYYTIGNATLADGNARWNEASQTLAQDMNTWNQISALQVDLDYAQSRGDTDTVEASQYKLDMLMYGVSDELTAGIEWANAQENYATPFEKDGFIDTYYADASTVMDEGYTQIDQGDEANNWADKLGLVSVILAVVLFMLGIVGVFQSKQTKIIIASVSVAALIFGVAIMLQVPITWL